MALRSTNPIVFDPDRQVEVMLPNNGYDCGPVEVLRLLSGTIEYLHVIRMLAESPTVDQDQLKDKRKRVTEGYDVLMVILRREVGDYDKALEIAARIDMDLKLNM